MKYKYIKYIYSVFEWIKYTETCLILIMFFVQSMNMSDFRSWWLHRLDPHFPMSSLKTKGLIIEGIGKSW